MSEAWDVFPPSAIARGRVWSCFQVESLHFLLHARQTNFRRLTVISQHVEVIHDGNGETEWLSQFAGHLCWKSVCRLEPRPYQAVFSDFSREQLLLKRIVLNLIELLNSLFGKKNIHMGL